MKKIPFNMVEVLLALIVIGLGAVSAMAVLQPSAQASRDSVGDSCCADLAGQFLSYFEANARQNWSSMVASGNNLTSSPPSSSPSIADSNVDDSKFWSGAVSDDPNIFTSGGSLNPSNGIYGVKMGSDFAGHVKVWKTQILDFNYLGTVTSLPVSKAIRICVEISYPVGKPYQYRDKRYFSMELFNQ